MDPGSKDDGLSPTARAERSAAPYISATWKLVGGIGVGTAAGWFADAKLHSSPWGLLLGVLVGMGAGFFGFFRAVTALGKRGPGR